MEFLTIESAQVARDSGIDAVAALDFALGKALSGLSAEQAQTFKHTVGNLMGEVIDQLIKPAVRCFPELAPNDDIWLAVVHARARARLELNRAE